MANSVTQKNTDPLGILSNDPLGILGKPEKTMLQKVGDIAKSSGRIAGTVGGGAVAFPLSGLAGVVTGLNELFKNAPSIEDLISGKVKLSEEQEDELIRRATQKAAKTIESIQSIPAGLIKSEGEQKAVEIISKPFEWIHQAGLYYSDLAVKHGASPATGALIQGGFETAVLWGMPKLAGKLRAEVKAGKIKKAVETQKQIHREKLRKLKAEPKRFEKLAAAEKKVKESVEFEKAMPIKKAAESAQVFQDRFAPAQTSKGKQILKTEMMSKAEFQGEGQVSPGMKGPYQPPVDINVKPTVERPVVPDSEYFLRKATERVGGTYGVKERIIVNDPLNIVEGEYGLKILDRSIPEPKKYQAQAIVDNLTKEGRSAKESAIIFDEFLRENQSLQGKVELTKDLKYRQSARDAKLSKGYDLDADTLKLAKDREFFLKEADRFGISRKEVGTPVEKRGFEQQYREPEYVMNPAIKIKDTIIEGDYKRGGHTEIINKIDKDPKLKKLFDEGKYKEGGVTDNGVFYEKKPGVDFSEIKGRDILEIKDRLAGDTTLSFMGTQQAYNFIKNEIPRLRKAGEKLHDIVDVESPFIRHGAKETAFHAKNFFTKWSLIEGEAPIVGREIARAVNFDPARLRYEIVAAAESRRSLKSSPKEIRKAAKILHDYFEKSKGEYKARGVDIDFKKRILNDINAKTDKATDPKKIAELRLLRRKANDLEFVHIPSALWFEKTLGRPEGARSVLKVLAEQKRKTFNIKSLIDRGIIKPEDVKVSDILSSYARRKGRDFALLDLVAAAKKDGLAIKVKKNAEIPDTFVDVPKTAPILKGHKIHPVLFDFINDITGKGLDLGKVGSFLSLTKMAAFINPLILPMYDVMQHGMLAAVAKWGKGVKTNIPGKFLAEGIRDYIKRSPEYIEAFENGLFSKPYNNPFQSLKGVTEWSMKNRQQKFLRMAESLYPWKTVQSIYNASWHMAWEMDAAIRMGAYKLLRSKGLSPRDAAQVGALFHGDYASVPAKIRRILNVPFFTPTFKLAMGKLYYNMVKGAIQAPLKGIGLKKNVSPRMKYYAAGLAGLLIANTVKNLVMEWHGFETDQWGRRWKKEVESSDGKKKELMVTFSDPSNVAQKYVFRAIQSFAAEKEKPFIDFVSANRWEIHPLWRSIVEALMNQNPKGEKIYSIVESGTSDQYLKQSWYITKNIVRLFGSFDPEQYDKEGLELLEKETNRAMTATVKLLAFAYTRNPEGVRKALKLKRFNDEFRREIIFRAIKRKKIDPELIEKYRKKVDKLKD